MPGLRQPGGSEHLFHLRVNVFCFAVVQVIAAFYALSLDLRLQVLWSAKSAIIPGGYNVDVMCRWGEGERERTGGVEGEEGAQGGGGGHSAALP